MRRGRQRFRSDDITIMRREMRGERADVQAGLGRYAAAGAHRFVIMMLEAGLRPENYQAELRRLATLYV
jgi:hypothetical protein